MNIEILFVTLFFLEPAEINRWYSPFQTIEKAAWRWKVKTERIDRFRNRFTRHQQMAQRTTLRPMKWFAESLVSY